MNVTEVPFGSLVIGNGQARTYTNSYDLVIVRSHPRAIQENIMSGLQREFERILTAIRQWDGNSQLTEVLSRRFVNLQVSPLRRRRWAPLEPIGRAFGNLFGLASSNDLDKFREKVANIILDLQDQRSIIQDMMIVVNDTMKRNDDMQNTIASLIDGAAQVRRLVNALMSNATDLFKETGRLYVYDVAEAILSAVEFYKLQSELFERRYLHFRDFAEIGHLTESLIDEELLQESLHMIHSPLPASYFYKYSSVKIVRFSRMKIAFVVSIPIVDAEIFTAWRVAAVPFFAPNGRGAIITPETTSIAIGHISGSVIDTSHCRFKDPVVCKNPVRRTSMPCIQGIIAKDSDLLRRCPVQPISLSEPHVLKISSQQVLLATPAARVVERCIGRAVQTTVLKDGTYLLGMDEGCTVSADSWSFTVGMSEADTYLIRDEFLLRDVNITFTLPVEATTPALSWSHIKKLSNFAQLRLPVFHSLAKIRYVTSHDGYVGWVLAGIFCLVAMVGVSVYVERRWHLCRQCLAQRLPEPVLPTSDVDDKDPQRVDGPAPPPAAMVYPSLASYPPA